MRIFIVNEKRQIVFRYSDDGTYEMNGDYRTVIINVLIKTLRFVLRIKKVNSAS
jgi:hypothetical protein